MNEKYNSWPQSIEVTRNDVTLTLPLTERSRELKGKEAPPFYTYTITSDTLDDYRKWLGDELFFAHLQAKLNSVAQFCTKDCYSADGSKVDDETIATNLTNYTGRGVGIKKLEEEMNAIIKDFVAGKVDPQDLDTMRAKLADIQAKIEAKRRDTSDEN